MLLDVVGKEKYFQHHEDDKDFDEDDEPQRASQRHAAEAVVIEVENLVEKSRLAHRYWYLLR